MKRRTAAIAPSAGVLRKLAREFDLDLIVLFGSQATGRTHPRSDVDIAVRSRVPGLQRDLAWHQRLWAAMEDLVGRDDVDTIVLNGKDSLLLFEVASDGRLLYQRKPETFIEFQSYAARRYWDDEKFRAGTREHLMRDLNIQ